MSILFKKYNSTPHLPFSPGVQKDDSIHPNLDFFLGKEVIMPEKLDGENTSMYSIHDGNIFHARSLDSAHNWTRDWCKRVHSGIAHEIPKGMKLIGENMFAEHSIKYDNLNSYFYLFAIWQEIDGKVYSLDWDSVVMYAELLDLQTPKILDRFIFDEAKVKKLANSIDTNIMEGFVMRTTEGFFLPEDNGYMLNLAKWVREGHVQTDEHWLKNAKQNPDLIAPIKPAFMQKE